jgi:Ca2+-binding EF-hand superfamily protein
LIGNLAEYKVNGRLGEPEFKNLAYDLGNHLSDGEVTMALKMIDKDGDGTVDYEEFVEWWRSSDRWGKLQLSEEQLTKLQNAAKYFRYWDKDGGGSIDREEFKGLHADLLKRGLTDKDLDRCLEDLDENRDGEIQVCRSLPLGLFLSLSLCLLSLSPRRKAACAALADLLFFPPPVQRVRGLARAPWCDPHQDLHGYQVECVWHYHLGSPKYTSLVSCTLTHAPGE